VAENFRQVETARRSANELPAKTTLFDGGEGPGLRRNFLRPITDEQPAKTTLFDGGRGPGLRRNFLRPMN
jgi:hypothetical protein